MLNDDLRIVQMNAVQMKSNLMNATLKASVGYCLPESLKYIINRYFYTSIHYLYCLSLKGCRKAGANLQQGRTTIHTYIHVYGKFRVASSHNLRVFVLWEGTRGSPSRHKRTYKLHAESPQSASRFIPRTFFALR